MSLEPERPLKLKTLSSVIFTFTFSALINHGKSTWWPGSIRQYQSSGSALAANVIKSRRNKKFLKQGLLHKLKCFIQVKLNHRLIKMLKVILKLAKPK